MTSAPLPDYLIPLRFRLALSPRLDLYACFIALHMLKRSLCGACSAAYSSRAWISPAVASQHSSTSTAGPSRSHIFDEPLDPAPRPKSLRRQRQLEQIAAARDGTSNSEREAQARWHADPWCRSRRQHVECADSRPDLADAGATMRGDPAEDAQRWVYSYAHIADPRRDDQLPSRPSRRRRRVKQARSSQPALTGSRPSPPVRGA